MPSARSLQGTIRRLSLVVLVLSFAVPGTSFRLSFCANEVRILNTLQTVTPQISQASRHRHLTNPTSSSSSLALSGGSEDAPKPQHESTSRTVLSYYLLWSPGVFPKTAVATLSLFLIGETFRRIAIPIEPWRWSQLSVVQNWILPLLSSACCMIQLIINALVGVGGCAGFNKHLGPKRPYFLAVLVYLSCRYSHASPSSYLWRALVALSPEILDLWNQRRNYRHTNQADGPRVSVELDIPTMGCVACINKINSCTRQHAFVIEADAWLQEKGGKASMTIAAESEQEARRQAETVVQVIQAAGFSTCKTDSVKMADHNH